MERAADVAIVGGGVIGCAVAYELARRGVRAVVLERGRVGAEASSASAGMLAPLTEASSLGPLVGPALAALERHRELAEAVREDAGIDVELRETGILRAAFDEAEAADLRERLAWQGGLLPLYWLDGPAARAEEPALSPEVTAAVLSPREAQLNPGRLVEALAAAAVHRGATVEEGVEVDGLLTQGHRVTGVRAGSRTWAAGTVVLAAGSWSGLYGSWLGLRLPVRPVKGQILA
ncbi:MAG TPA: FAD-dependent oxidoreductase, partial [Dehalococcoidia bacterium]